tara:strand:- start:417 stop:596 length:180 start_codon:yes stop_codon:yes gene_type:complete
MVAPINRSHNEGGAPLAPRSSPLCYPKRAAQATLEPAEATLRKAGDFMFHEISFLTIEY